MLLLNSECSVVVKSSSRVQSHQNENGKRERERERERARERERERERESEIELLDLVAMRVVCALTGNVD